MEIRVANASDASEIIRLYQSSQAATQIPNPKIYPPDILGKELYSRDAIERYVAVSAGRIIGHGLIEHPNPLSLPLWKGGIEDANNYLIEFGGAFVEPTQMRKGVYSELLRFRLGVIRGLGAVPVSATWSQTTHVQRLFVKNGGREVATQRIPAGLLHLFIF